MAHPRTLSAAVLPAALLLLTTCGHDVTAPPAPTQLAFLQQPADLVAGHRFTQAVKVRAEDAHGNQVASFTGNVTVALANNPGGSTLGTTTVAAVNGVATFGDLTVSQTGTGYWLTASATGLARAASSAFDVTPGAATQLVFGTEPRTTVADHQISPAVKVRALDALGNLATGFTGAVAVAPDRKSGCRACRGTTPVA